MVQRIVGLASGMDIDSMVKSMMDAAKQPLIKLQQKQQTLEWQRDDYRTLNQKFYDFRSSLTQMKLTAQYRARTTTSSNESLVTATATNVASLSSTTIQSVTQLATTATRVTNNSVASDASNPGIDVTDTLLNQSSNFATNINWSKGAITSTTVTATGTNSLSLNLTGTPLADDSGNVSMNVKVNGKTYKVVTSDVVSAPSQLDDNTVLFTPSSDGTTGTLQFKSTISSGTSVSVEYASETATQNVTLASIDTKTIQLSRKGLATDTTDTFSMTVGDHTYQLDDSGNLYDTADSSIIVGTINGDSGMIQLNDTFYTENPVSDSTPLNVSVIYQQKYTSFSMGAYNSDGEVDHTFFVQASDSLNDVINDVNNSNIGVTMFYDDATGKMSLTRKESGDFNKSGEEIIIPEKTDSSSYNFLSDTLGFGDSTESGGENAKFTINGLTTERTSNSFTINGVSYTLKNTFNTESNPSSPVTISVNNDTDTIFNNIKNFVDQYNDLISTVQSKLNEERYTDYPPLTDDQRSQMTDNQQDQWDEKAKSGLLKGDLTLTSALSNMRSLIYMPVQNANVSSAYNQLSSIGITTSPDYTQGGKLEIDEDKLRAAIENDPDSVENLFRGTGSSTSEEGIIQRLYDSVNNTYNTIVDKAGTSASVNSQFSIGKDLDQISKQIDDMNDKLDDLENKYYAQFDAMEQAIQQYNNQATSLASYFS